MGMRYPNRRSLHRLRYLGAFVLRSHDRRQRYPELHGHRPLQRQRSGFDGQHHRVERTGHRKRTARRDGITVQHDRADGTAGRHGILLRATGAVPVIRDMDLAIR